MKIIREQKSLVAFVATSLSVILCSAKVSQTCCQSAAGEECCPCIFYQCLGPDDIIVNSPVRPYTCNGDLTIYVAGTFWKAQQSGLEYAVETAVSEDSSELSENAQLNNLINAEYVQPKFEWDGGFKVGVGYNSFCDGWDLTAIWTHFRECLKNSVQLDESENLSLILLWSAFQFPDAAQAPTLTANQIESRWKLQLDFVDLELGREYWTSRLLSIRPFIGFRAVSILQDFDLLQDGGSFTNIDFSLNYNDEVELDNNYRGIGLRSGIDTLWNLSCGFGLYTNLAADIIYGKFHIKHEESMQQAESPFDKINLLETKESFYGSRGIVDLALGLQWRALVCDCKYGINIALGWEQHLFFHQNQLWRIARSGGVATSGILNDSGENIFHQRRGNLSTAGWTLSGSFSF